jgi:hypothetical protein
VSKTSVLKNCRPNVLLIGGCGLGIYQHFRTCKFLPKVQYGVDDYLKYQQLWSILAFFLLDCSISESPLLETTPTLDGKGARYPESCYRKVGNHCFSGLLYLSEARRVGASIRDLVESLCHTRTLFWQPFLFGQALSLEIARKIHPSKNVHPTVLPCIPAIVSTNY